ncbi:hypothetical protein [Streptomyces sp. NPDC051286]|uniref:hypothetical protein n=1 Tax=Streptomyces sp. NPDC051286 TaxID=3365647 RepID=UPI0037A6439F
MGPEGGGSDMSADSFRGAEGVDAETEEGRLAELLAELSEKVRQAGVAGIRILTVEEVQQDQLSWFQMGWDEHACARNPDHSSAAGHPAGGELAMGPGRLLRFPDRLSPDPDPDPDRPEPRPHPLPIVGSGDAHVRELMPHRPRKQPRGREDVPGD